MTYRSDEYAPTEVIATETFVPDQQVVQQVPVQQVPVQQVPVQQVPVQQVPVQPVAAQVITTSPAVHQRVATSYGRRYAFDSVVVGIVGLLATIVGLIAIARAGLDGSMDEPVVDVLGFTHTATLGIIEAAIGICLLISAAMMSRGAATFFGLLLGIGGVVGAVQTDSFRESLALESGLAWLAVVAAAIVVAVSFLVPRKVTRVDRVENY